MKDPVLTGYVRELACRVAGDYCGDLRVYLLKNPTFNASMAPNGVMLVHTGLLIRSLSSDLFTTNFMYDTNTLHLNQGDLFFEDRTMTYGLHVDSRPFLSWATSLRTTPRPTRSSVCARQRPA